MLDPVALSLHNVAIAPYSARVAEHEFIGSLVALRST